MCIIPTDPVSTSAQPTSSPAKPNTKACAAKLLSPQQRQDLALAALAGQSVSALARRYQVSRKFVRQLRHLAHNALDRAFSPPPPADEVLFTIPVTRSWLEQVALSLDLTCKSSLRATSEHFRDIFDLHRAPNSVRNVLLRAQAKARLINSLQDLKRVRFPLLDEIFQSRLPFLVGVDAFSTYCFLLSKEEHRDGATWSARLRDAVKQGLSPLACLADEASGLRAGHEGALPLVPLWPDLFHPLRDWGRLVRALDAQAYRALARLYDLEKPRQQKGKPQPTAEEAASQRQQALVEANEAVALADDLALLPRWLRWDVLGVAGPCLEDRQMLYDFLVAEVKKKQEQCPERLGPMVERMERLKEGLLGWCEQLEVDLGALAAWLFVPEEVVREMLAVQEMPQTSRQRWRREWALRQRLGERYTEVENRVKEVRKEVVRASSLVENLNSRLRKYLFMGREVSQGDLDLVRFYLNHREFERSAREERVGKSPAQLLTGEDHPHWLEMLGYTRFRRAA